MMAAGKTTRIVAAMIVATAVVALTPMAFAQGHKGSGPSGPASPDETAKTKQRADEAKAAKAAMDRIPDSKEKYNPWKIER
jgi:hypothetical protein